MIKETTFKSPKEAKTSPNLFIIGAPKCGTTTLYHWLSTHPKIFMSPVKETTFFCGFAHQSWSGPKSEEFLKNRIGTLEEYEALFSGKALYPWRGEASTDYLWSKDVPFKIAQQYGIEGLRFIAILRNPVERAFSEHGHLVRENMEHLNFVQALEEEDRRFQMHWQPLFYHKRRGVYYDALKRYIDTFGRSSIHIVLYDDLNQKPLSVLEEIFAFLNVEVVPIKTGTVYNKSGKPRVGFLHNFLRSSSPLKRIVKKMIGSHRTKLLRRSVENLNLKPLTMTTNERQYAAQLFHDDIELTEQLIETELSAWKVP